MDTSYAFDSENEIITQSQPVTTDVSDIQVNYDKVREVRENLMNKYTDPVNRKVLERIGVFWSDVDNQRIKKISMDEYQRQLKVCE